MTSHLPTRTAQALDKARPFGAFRPRTACLSNSVSCRAVSIALVVPSGQRLAVQ